MITIWLLFTVNKLIVICLHVLKDNSKNHRINNQYNFLLTLSGKPLTYILVLDCFIRSWQVKSYLEIKFYQYNFVDLSITKFREKYLLKTKVFLVYFK